MVERELYMERIRSLIDKDLIKVITGVRRSGKSYFLNLIKEELKEQGIKEENIIIINLERGPYRKIKTTDELDEVVVELTKNLNGRIYLLFDEIQNVKGWETLINSYRLDYDCDLYITGSNSNLLSGELATNIAGRYIEIKIYPFSYKEALLANPNLSFKEYMTYGGFPYIQFLDKYEKDNYLDMLYDSIIRKDIINRCNIRNPDIIDRLIIFLMNNIGQTFSVQTTFNVLKNEKREISKDTLYNYLKCLEDACLIHKVRRENIKGKNLLRFSEKYYFIDWGFNEALFGDNKKYISQILENIVYIEFLRRGYKVTIGKLKDKEVDFICRKHGRKLYVQVSYILESEKTLEREFNPLLEIKDNYEKIVISTDSFDMSQKGIKHLNIEDFLLSDDY